uniref:FtsH_ext domain-containing protein n=1 Tax=Steinernema glaseri TaxID=37863 RepID=A0A1I7Y9H5_9BILA
MNLVSTESGLPYYNQPIATPCLTTRQASPIQTRWFKFKNKYFTVRNALIAGGVVVGLILLIVFYNLVLADDGKKYLAYEKNSLGYFRNYNLKISFDESNNLILLSRQLGSSLDIERFALDKKTKGFLYVSLSLRANLGVHL